MNFLLTHSYYLYEDPKERDIMRPYPPLGMLYLWFHLKAKGFDVAVFDTTFGSPEAFTAYVVTHRPPVVGLYANLIRWLVNEVGWHTHRRKRSKHFLTMARAFLAAKAGWLGMLLTQYEVEHSASTQSTRQHLLPEKLSSKPIVPVSHV